MVLRTVYVFRSSAMSTLCDSKPSRLLCPSDYPGKNAGVGWHVLLQGIFPTQGSDSCLVCLLPLQLHSLPLVSPGKLICDGHGFCKFSGNETSQEEALQGRAHCVFSPLPSAPGLSGNHLLRILQEGVKPLVGTVGLKHRSLSLLPCPSFL